MEPETTEKKKPEVSWEHAALFQEQNGKMEGLAVRVQKLPLRFPRYSLEVGRVRDGKFQRYISPQVRVESGQVNLTPLNLEALNRLIAEAEHFIYTQMQTTEDDEQMRRAAKERRFGGNGREVRHTGKTERERRKKKERGQSRESRP